MGRLLRKILIPIIVLSTLVGLPIGLVYGCFYSKDRVEDIVYDENFSNEKYLKNIAVNSFESTTTDHSISLNITKEDINNLINQAVLEQSWFPKEYVDQTCISIEDGQYVFTIGAKFKKIFSTVVKLYTKLEHREINNKKAFVFNVVNCRIGNLNKMDDLAISIMSNYLSDEDLTNSLKESGLNINVDLSNKRIVYYEDNLINDIVKLTSEAPNNDIQLIISILKDFLNNEYIDFDFEKSINLKIDLEPFADNKYGLIDDSKSQNLDLTKYADNVVTLYQNNIIEPDYFRYMFQYFIFGYEKSGDEIKEYVKDKDFSCVGINNTMLYQGDLKYSHRELMDIIGEQETNISDLMSGGVISFMNETQANEYIAGSGFIGYTFLLTDYDYTNVNFISIDNFYCNMFRKDDVGYLDIVSGVNFNGYETSVVFELAEDVSSCTNYEMGFKINNIYFGEYIVENELSDYLFKIMSDCLQNDETICVDYETKTIVIDFNQSLTDEIKNAVSLIGTPKMRIEGEGIEDNNGRVVAYIE
ncbi:MAG: hypothetical protein PUG55_00940 [Bacillales bacterium]|nr:hypothetical protein [Bacillales bacterium]